LLPDDLREVTQADIRFGTTDTHVRIISHRVHGERHFGAIIVPANAAKNHSCAVVVEAKGVSWNYSPLDINSGLNAPAILGPSMKDCIIIAPSFRGEKMICNGREFVSDGDRTDSWDGATDDALALLNVALQSAPEADPARIYSFGRSRGGSVALLCAIRDKRIKGVVEWAGPTDWFSLMADEGWTQQELVEEGLRIHAKPNETAGQFIERFLLKAMNGTWNLQDTRLKMIAASPLYFTKSLPDVQIHHGVEDYNVPVINAHSLADSLKKNTQTAGHLEAIFYKGFGHDTDVANAAKHSARFLIEHMKRQQKHH
jgi:dipeptidyl aminopeptidase/acylaminoacyl peptidase